MNSPVSTYEDYLADEHVAAVNGIAWVEHSGVGRMPMANVPGLDAIDKSVWRTAHSPHVGEHSREILTALGHSGERIDEWVSAGAVGVHTT